MPRILVTGATGKVGQAFIPRLFLDPRFNDFTVRALCHHRVLDAESRLEVIQGSIEHREVVNRALRDVTHVLHLATCKETPESVMDVSMKGMFWLLEGCRSSSTFRQFILIGGDASIGHFFYPRAVPITEAQPHKPYPGCYALSKVLEEVMLDQYYTQYDLNGCCLRAPWIMEKDDFKYQLSFGKDVFGAPRWHELVGEEKAAEYAQCGAIPVMLDAQGIPVKRNFIHVDDLVCAILRAIDNPRVRQELIHVSMDEPVDYGELGQYLSDTRKLPAVPVATSCHSVWLDNTKAKLLLGWRPEYDLKKMVESAFGYSRAHDSPRKIWYPG